MAKRWPILLVAAASACTPTYATNAVLSSSAPAEYTIFGTSPYGLYGGLADLHPSPEAMASQAQQYCRNGYDKLEERASWNWQDGNTLDWRIRCR
jgi:hypothetical protein